MTAVVNSCLLHIYVPAETGSFMSFQIVTRSSSSLSSSVVQYCRQLLFCLTKHRDIRVRVRVQVQAYVHMQVHFGTGVCKVSALIAFCSYMCQSCLHFCTSICIKDLFSTCSMYTLQSLPPPYTAHYTSYKSTECKSMQFSVLQFDFRLIKTDGITMSLIFFLFTCLYPN